MSVNTSASLDTLPVELLHRILDSLDATTILRSFRNTCRHLQVVVKNYIGYVLNFDSIRKSEYDLLCRLIDPRDVKSLTLSQTDRTLDQIKLFFSHFRLQQFSHLRSLSLSFVSESRLYEILQGLDIRTLQSFSLVIKNFDDRRKTTTARLLSSFIAYSNLSRLELNIQHNRLERITWPSRCSFQYVKIDGEVSFDQMCALFRCSPYLRTLVMNSLSCINRKQVTSSPALRSVFRPLTSLTLDKAHVQIDDLESFLAVTTSLTHLKLVGSGNYCDGNRWEYFISMHLPLLNKFEFFLQDHTSAPDVRAILRAFETPFWLEEKKWFVGCETNATALNTIALYSVPVCRSILPFNIAGTSVTTLPEINDIRLSLMDSVRSVVLDLRRLMPLTAKATAMGQSPPLFRYAKRLELEFGDDLPRGWIEYVSALIDLTVVTEVRVSSTYLRQRDAQTLTDTAVLFQRTCLITTVDLCYGFYSRRSTLTAADIGSVVPAGIKHLAAAVKTLKEVPDILQRLQNLSSANFGFVYCNGGTDMTWLERQRNGSSYHVDSFSVSIWLGETIEETESSNKRMKLSEE